MGNSKNKIVDKSEELELDNGTNGYIEGLDEKIKGLTKSENEGGYGEGNIQEINKNKTEVLNNIFEKYVIIENKFALSTLKDYNVYVAKNGRANSEINYFNQLTDSEKLRLLAKISFNDRDKRGDSSITKNINDAIERKSNLKRYLLEEGQKLAEESEKILQEKINANLKEMQDNLDKLIKEQTEKNAQIKEIEKSIIDKNAQIGTPQGKSGEK